MPLRDHFRSPIDDVHSWEELHGLWPGVIVLNLVKILPEPFFAGPGVYLGSLYEVDVATYSKNEEIVPDEPSSGGLALATYAPPQPTVSISGVLPGVDNYEVRIYNSKRQRRLVATIEIVSPSNKDRPENRSQFISKIAALLRNHICVSIIDVISSMDFNLYAGLLEEIDAFDPGLPEILPPMYAATLKTRFVGNQKFLDAWYYPLSIGQPLPTLPIRLREDLSVPLELEATYEECCRALRIR